jgi:ubiquinone/menaquinone biosynthesis C-methylase UbiE
MNQWQSVQEYYGKVLKSKADLRTSACCSDEAMPSYIKPIAALIHEEVQSRFYGCGLPIPSVLEGLTILDLGCGAGRDAFILSKLVGEKGRVIGVDMTPEQLAVAQRVLPVQVKTLGLAADTLEFRRGYIEDLATAGIEDESIDLVISNCVINLSPQKESVFGEIFRVLKSGGELYFSDVFADRRLPAEVNRDPMLVGECLGGAMYDEDFRRVLAKSGCRDARLVSQSEITSSDPQVLKKIGRARFFSRTIRAFKLELEDRCEDYGEVAYYQGSIAHFEVGYALDDHHFFERGRPLAICSNTADMILKTRLAQHFRVEGNRSTHYGLFDCGQTSAVPGSVSTKNGGPCC